MNLWLLVLLAVVIIIYFVVSRVADKGKASTGGGTVHRAAEGGRDIRADFGEWLFYSGQAFKFGFFMLIHLFKFVWKILKVFFSWYKGKGDKVKKVPRTHLWCPRCQNYFSKKHACFKGEAK